MRFVPQTSQEAFDAAVLYFKNAKERCTAPGGGCRYLIPDTGQRCVVGSMIECESSTDEHNLAALLGSVMNPEVRGVLGLESPGLALLGQLQNLHDYPENWGPDGFTAWDKLVEVGKSFHLDPSGVSE